MIQIKVDFVGTLILQTGSQFEALGRNIKPSAFLSPVSHSIPILVMQVSASRCTKRMYSCGSRAGKLIEPSFKTLGFDT